MALTEREADRCLGIADRKREVTEARNEPAKNHLRTAAGDVRGECMFVARKEVDRAGQERG
jgi:hypothetical protein